MRGRLSLLFSLAAGTAPVAAQEPTDSSLIRLDTLQVPVTRATLSTSRSPYSLSVIGRAGIQDARATIGLDEALASVPGLIVDNRQNFSLGNRIVIRGLGARAAFGVRGIRVLVDGIPLTMPDGQTNLNNLDLGSAGTIHVLRGPASALFGNAAGGVIAVETEPAPAAAALEARLTAGDQGRRDPLRLWKLQAKAAGAAGAVDYLASVSRLEADGYRAHGAVRQTLVNARAGLRTGVRTRLTMVVNAADMPVAQSPGSLPLDSARRSPEMAWPRNVATAAGESARQVQLGLRLRHDGATVRSDVSVYGLSRSLDNPLPFGFIDLARRAGGVRAIVDASFGAWAFATGMDVEAQRDVRLEFDNVAGSPAGPPRRDQVDRVASIGPFGQVRIGGGATGLTLGARYDAVRFETLDRRDTVPDQSGQRTLGAASATAGLTHAFGHATVFANIASAFQTPTTTELLNAPPAAGEPCCPAGFNEELEPQRILSREVGVRSAPSPRLSWEVAAYWMDVRDALIAFQVAGAEGRDFFRNAGRTRHRGIEASVAATVSPGLDLMATYTLSDVRFRDDGSDVTSYEGNRVPGITPHRVFAAVTWSVLPTPTRITLEVRHHSRQHADDANTATAPAYTVVDVRVLSALRAGGIEMSPFVAVHNALDRHYFGSLTVNAAAGRYYEPAPGLSFTAGASIRTGSWRRR